jgi:hypothetical protein
MNLPHPESVTGAQIDNLLRICGLMTNVLCNPYREQESIPGASNAPGEARDSAEATFINACSRLDDIINDKSRWSLDFQRSLEKKAEDIQVAQLKFVQAQTEAAAELKTPHFRFRPTLQKAQDGSWVAYLGDPADQTGNTIVGLGRNPAEALRSFDEIFQGTVPQVMIDWLIEHEKAQDAGLPSPPYPNSNQNQNNEQQSMDSRRDRKTNNPGRAKNPRKRNRQTPESGKGIDSGKD